MNTYVLIVFGYTLVAHWVSHSGPLVVISFFYGFIYDPSKESMVHTVEDFFSVPWWLHGSLEVFSSGF